MKRILVNHKKIPNTSNRYDLTRFLYSGGAFGRARDAYNKIEKGELGSPIAGREELITAFRDSLETALTIGGSEKTLIRTFTTLTEFVRFMETHNLNFNISELKQNYIEYSEDLFQISSMKKNARLTKDTAYAKASSLSTLFARILNIPRQGSLLKSTRLKYKRKRKSAVSKEDEKQNLEETFLFGNFLYELISTLSSKSILGRQPIVRTINHHSMNSYQLIISKGLRKDLIDAGNDTPAKQEVKHILEHNRWVLFNLRIQAEIMMFAAQTGMNPSQIYSLKRQQFDYKPLGEDYEVRSYKHRKGGEVLFKIFKSYKKMLQDHIKFINKFSPESDLLFPVFKKQGKGFTEFYGHFLSLKDILREYSIPWIPPSKIRNTRTNWLLRRSGDDDLTAKAAQHAQKTLRDKYELPSQQRAMVEITQFWNKHDSIEQSNLQKSVISSECNGIPEAVEGIPENIVEPNCVNPSGCLWCKHLRDLDNFDYIWSLTSMRHLKSIEAALTFKKDETPSDLSIERLTQKLDWYRKSSQKRNDWVEEAELRIEEGSYHPSWSSIIEFLE